MTIDELSYQIIGGAMVVHTDLGQGLNEKAYDTCFGDQLTALGLQFEHQVRVPVMRRGRRLASTFRLDYVVRINFNVLHLRDGIKRVVNGYVPGTEV